MSDKIIGFILVVLIIAIILVLLGHFFKRVWAVADEQPWRPTPTKTEIVINGNRWQVEIIRDSWLKAKGLSGRDSLSNKTGMLFVFNNPARHSFWMKGMKFPLDIIWINNNRVIDITYNAQPLSLTPPPSSLSKIVHKPNQPANMALEINAGEATRFGIEVGNLINLSQ